MFSINTNKLAIAICVALLLGMILGIAALQNSYEPLLNQVSLPTQKHANTSTITSSIPSTGDWLNYTNTRLGYTLQYPPTWGVTALEPANQINTSDVTISPKDPLPDPCIVAPSTNLTYVHIRDEGTTSLDTLRKLANSKFGGQDMAESVYLVGNKRAYIYVPVNTNCPNGMQYPFAHRYILLENRERSISITTDMYADTTVSLILNSLTFK
jgi:hypothetical protein